MGNLMENQRDRKGSLKILKKKWKKRKKLAKYPRGGFLAACIIELSVCQEYVTTRPYRARARKHDLLTEPPFVVYC